MISSAIDKIHVALIDDKTREVLTLDILSTESIIEKHDDRQIIIARMQDLRLYSLLPELENSIIWVKKKNLKNILQFRTEWRKLNEAGIPENKDLVPTRSYILGDIEGFRINIDFRNIYNIQDYLSDILGETIILIDKTQHSFFWWKITRYIEILYISGIPSEANTYWRNLRELKLFLEQFTYLFDDISYDLSISDIRVSIGDEEVKLEPFLLESFQMKREQVDDQDHALFLVNKVTGRLLYKENNENKELAFCQPIDAFCKVIKKKKS